MIICHRGAENTEVFCRVPHGRDARAHHNLWPVAFMLFQREVGELDREHGVGNGTPSVSLPINSLTFRQT
jgi:hypothetical protein